MTTLKQHLLNMLASGVRHEHGEMVKTKNLPEKKWRAARGLVLATAAERIGARPFTTEGAK